jgi:tyrosinase
MTTAPYLRKRRSISALQADYDNGIKQPLEDLMRAWKGIKELPPESEHSFFRLGGYHGEPFQYRQAVDALPQEDIYAYWGGYCNHGNVLFPTWHRVYVLKVEEALQSIVPGVMMPYWDESDAHSLEGGIPSVLTQEKFLLDGALIDNPLRSFVLPVALSDHLGSDERLYEKPAGYEVVRYPLSGLVGTEEARAATARHNAKFPNFADNVSLLNDNVRAWLRGAKPTPEDPHPRRNGIYVKLQECLNAPNYTVFSNTTSAAQWNAIMPGKVTSLESPHNSVHVAVGGYDFKDMSGEHQSGQIAGANGDMGENNTAAMDPIFFFHHCNIDRMFWLWQKRHEATRELNIIEGFAGTAASDAQGPTPGYSPAATLDLESPLHPFRKADGSVYTSLDCVDIETQLGFTYEAGSLDEDSIPSGLLKAADISAVKKLHVSGVNRTAVQGSFVLSAYAEVIGADGQPYRHDLGHSAVLSRFNVVKCANCLTHADVMAHFPLNGLSDQQQQTAKFHVFLHTRTGTIALTPGVQPQTKALFKSAAPLKAGKPIELRVIA